MALRSRGVAAGSGIGRRRGLEAAGEACGVGESGPVEVGQGKPGDGGADVAEGVGALVAEGRGVGSVADADGIEDDEDGLFHGGGRWWPRHTPIGCQAVLNSTASRMR